jgi:low affinity Fe/Cu permease
MNFDKLAQAVARSAGRPLTFIAATVLVVVWGVSGPVFGYSDTWQFVINTGTIIVTFLMVFLIQNTQNRDTDALQVKTAPRDRRGAPGAAGS